jgi:hypothetical protein
MRISSSRNILNLLVSTLSSIVLVAGCGSAEDDAPDADVETDVGGDASSLDLETTEPTQDIGSTNDAEAPESGIVDNGMGIDDCHLSDPSQQAAPDLQWQYLDEAEGCSLPTSYACRPLTIAADVTNDAGCMVEPNEGIVISASDSAMRWEQELPALNTWWQSCTEAESQALNESMANIVRCDTAPPAAAACTPEDGVCPSGCMPVHAWPTDTASSCVEYSPENAEVVACRGLETRIHPARDCWSRAGESEQYFTAFTFEGSTVVDGWNRGCLDWDRIVPADCE